MVQDLGPPFYPGDRGECKRGGREADGDDHDEGGMRAREGWGWLRVGG